MVKIMFILGNWFFFGFLLPENGSIALKGIFWQSLEEQINPTSHQIIVTATLKN